MRLDRANSGLETYLNQEAYLNNLKRISINSGTEYALAVAMVDADGNQLNASPNFAVIDHASSGDNTIVAANSTKKIRVISGVLVSSGTVNVRFESAAGGTALTGVINLVANTGFIIPYNPMGNFETAANQLLNLELSGAVSVDGWITYVLV